ncbi:unnamed protein product, partial [Hapterophycus canaliculatus]
YYGCSTDIWTSSKRNMFISLTLHFVQGGSMRTIDFACQPFNESHTGVNIARILKSIFVDKGLDPKKCLGITMDNAANM